MKKVKLNIDKKKDVECFAGFFRDAECGDYEILKWAVCPHKSLHGFFSRKSKQESLNRVSEYVLHFYENNEKSLEKFAVGTRRIWDTKQKDFLKLSRKLFGESKWPTGRYVGYFTIWGLYPRFLEDKTFLLPFTHRIPGYNIAVIVHELLHFKFYDFFRRRFPWFKNPESNMFVWHVSEIFNGVVQSLPGWLEIFQIKPIAYPNHVSLTKKCLKWVLEEKKRENALAITQKIIEEVNNNRSKLRLTRNN